MHNDQQNSEVTGQENPYSITKDVSFGEYIITVKLGRGNEFVGIKRVVVRKDFLTPEQRARAFRGNDASDSYDE